MNFQFYGLENLYFFINERLRQNILYLDELSYKRRIGPSTVLQDKEAIYFANHYASVWARLGYKCAELFQDYLTLCSLGSQVRNMNIRKYIQLHSIICNIVKH